MPTEPYATLPTATDDSIRALLTSLALPLPTDITRIAPTAAYHAVYVVTLPDPHSALVLRVAGNQLPATKTQNEAATHRWVETNTSIPLARLVAFDATTTNALGCEFTLHERADGVPASTIYGSLGDAQRKALIARLAGVVLQLLARPFAHLGGLSLEDDGPGALVEVRSWQTRTAARAFGAAAAPDLRELNPPGPFESWTALVLAKLRASRSVLASHSSLKELDVRLGGRVDALIAAVDARADELDAVDGVLVHNDLHLGNVVVDPATLQVTAVLDWEFAAVVPRPASDPGNFLLVLPEDGDGQKSIEEARADREWALREFRAGCAAEGRTALLGGRMTEGQEAVRDAVELLGWIVRSVPCGEHLGVVEEWCEELEEAFDEFDV